VNIVLIGFMGTGKSVVGPILAKGLGWAFLDTDQMIETEAGRSIQDIFSSVGESAFREMETRVLRQLGGMDRTVFATGGGSPLKEENWETLEGKSVVVCLRARPETVWDRLQKGPQVRPLLAPGASLLMIRERMAERGAAYGRAPFCIDTDDLTPEQVAEKILELIGDKR
jgi:shikimate kinase